ncbi:hypothetical protein [Caballeronia grimmiae]|uniref:hypothetical protein n=1 Tax=Caballeronia grimmiae TaxID=1071679 RepID=UPI0038BBD64C
MTDFDVFVAEKCEELISLPARLPPGVHLLPSNLVVQALRDVFFRGNAAEMARALGELRGQVNCYIHGEFPAPLIFFIRAALVTGASMHQIFVSNAFESAETAHSTHTFELRRAGPRRIFSQESIDNALRAALDGNGSMSVQAVAITMGMDGATIWGRSPELCSRVSKHHATFMADAAARRRAAFESKVQEVLKRLRDQDIRPTASAIRDALHDQGCFLNEWKRAVILKQCREFDL